MEQNAQPFYSQYAMSILVHFLRNTIRKRELAWDARPQIKPVHKPCNQKKKKKTKQNEKEINVVRIWSDEQATTIPQSILSHLHIKNQLKSKK